MSNSGNHNSGTVAPKAFGVSAAESRGNAGDTPATTRPIRHVYVHIPFCARICPYCAFYKELLNRSQTQRFCEALLREVREQTQDRPASRANDSHFGEVAGSPGSFKLTCFDKDVV